MCIHTTTKSISDKLAQGIEYHSRTAHASIMHHYGIPTLDIGETFRTKILTEGGDWLKLTTDNVHPLDNGYAVYADAVIAYLRTSGRRDTHTNRPSGASHRGQPRQRAHDKCLRSNR